LCHLSGSGPRMIRGQTEADKQAIEVSHENLMAWRSSSIGLLSSCRPGGYVRLIPEHRADDRAGDLRAGSTNGTLTIRIFLNSSAVDGAVELFQSSGFAFVISNTIYGKV